MAVVVPSTKGAVGSPNLCVIVVTVVGTIQKTGEKLVRLAGIEPATYSLEGCCSIRLSYRRVL